MFSWVSAVIVVIVIVVDVVIVVNVIFVDVVVAVGFVTVSAVLVSLIIFLFLQTRDLRRYGANLDDPNKQKCCSYG